MRRSGSLPASTSSTGGTNEDARSEPPRAASASSPTSMSVAPGLGASPADSNVYSARGLQYGSPAGSSSNASQDSPRPKTKIEDCTLGAPISTLRNLSSLRHGEETASQSVHPPSPYVSDSLVLDPVDRGIMSMEDAERCFSMCVPTSTPIKKFCS